MQICKYMQFRIERIYVMKKRVLQILPVCFLCCMLGMAAWNPVKEEVTKDTGARDKDAGEEMAAAEKTVLQETEKETALVLEEESVAVHIPGLKHKYRFMFLSDLHIIVESDEVSAGNLENVRARHEMFQSLNGIYSARLWEELPEYFNTQHSDAILFGGDMIDYASAANITALKEGIKKLDAPVMYVRADHDYNPYNCDSLDKKDMKKLHESIDGYEDLPVMEFEDLCIVGINNSTKQISKGQLKRFREAVNLGKPIILLTHVPLASKVDGSLLEESKKVWQDRALVWGKGCSNEPNKNTEAFLELVYDAKSPVKAVMCGHLHFTWEGKLTENCMQHVFSAAYPGRYGVITVDGKNDGL